MAGYTARVSWSRRSEETFTDGRFSRAHAWIFDGGSTVLASSSPQVVRPPLSDPAGVDPEEALVASLSSCHMLFFLEFARQRGFVVESYVDDAIGIVGKREDGRIGMTSVTLKPNLVFAGEKRPSNADVESLHRKAHDACYIANSVTCEITVQGHNEGLAPP